MGIFSKEKIKQKIFDIALDAAKKSSELVSTASYLTQEQIDFIESKREEYLSKLPSPDSKGNQEKIRRNLGAMGIEIFQSYLPQISSLYLPVPFDVHFNPNNNIRYFNINKWVNDSEENSFEKLMNVYQVLNEENCNIALIYNRKQEGCTVSLAVVDNSFSSEPTRINTYNERLRSAVKGNFPGTDIPKENIGTGLPPCLKNIDKCSIAAVSNLATEKSQNFISQSMEKLLDGIIPQSPKSEYTIILLATPIEDQDKRKLRLCELYSKLAPYSEWSTDYTYSDSDTVNSQAAVDVNVGSSIGAQALAGASVSANANAKASANAKANAEAGFPKGSGSAQPGSKSNSQTDNQKSNSSNGQSGNQTGSPPNSQSSNQAGNPPINAQSDNQKSNPSRNQNENSSGGKSVSGGLNVSFKPKNAVLQKLTDEVKLDINLDKDGASAQISGTGNPIGANANTGADAGADAGTEANAGAKAEADAHAGINFGMDFAKSSNLTAIVGRNEGITQNFVNFNVKHTLKKLENQMKRLEQCTALGMWDFAAYIISEDSITVNNVAHTYLALTQGDESYMSQSAINIWHRNYGSSQAMQNENEQARYILKSVSMLQHPVFALKYKSADWAMYPSVVTATTALSGKELAYSLNFPRKSVSGFPVLECAPFGRNIVSYREANRNLRIGTIYHMHRAESNSQVILDRESLISHIFIAGSIGSGKTNTASVILDKITQNSKVKFLVIEPAKGEYKNIFGGRDDVNVYGTNPKITELLRINPFSFPKGISVDEHIDRLIEIFSICLPMDSAMPAILRESMIRAYESVGWNVTFSENDYSNLLYPDFSELLDQIKVVLTENDCSDKLKNDCFGVLSSRIKTFTSGMNAQIFSANELDNSELFDENVIVDLSRLGSSEIRSFIMGLIVMKLEEYRLSENSYDKKTLRHVTVMEEAHDLLRRTSGTHTDLLGKSVEMLTDSISELREFGEGFIIADQAPELLHTAIIRNTNTKIVHRLPELSDRELVGKTIGLNSSQINELSKLDIGVAAVYQNDWVEPILCQIDKFYDSRMKRYSKPYVDIDTQSDYNYLKGMLINSFLRYDRPPREADIDLPHMSRIILKSKVKPIIKYDFFRYFTSDSNSEPEALARLVYDLFETDEAIRTVERSVGKDNASEWIRRLAKSIHISELEYGGFIYSKIINCILTELVNRNILYEEILKYFSD